MSCSLQRWRGGIYEPTGFQCLEHAGVAQPTLGLLEIWHRGVRQFAHGLVALAAQRPQFRQSHSRLAAPVSEHGRAQTQGQAAVTSQVPNIQQPQGDLQVSGRIDHLGKGSDGVVQAPTRVPDRIPQRRGQVTGLDVVRVHEDDVQVGVRGKFTPPESSNRDNGHTNGWAIAGVVGLGHQLVSRDGS